MRDFDTCPICGGITEAGGENTCVCYDEDYQDCDPDQEREYAQGDE